MIEWWVRPVPSGTSLFPTPRTEFWQANPLPTLLVSLVGWGLLAVPRLRGR